MKTKDLILHEKFNNIISTRDAIRNLFNFMNASFDELVIDFSGISFISSSAAHQLVLEIRDLNKYRTEVTFINICDDVKRMIDLAKTDRKNVFTTKPISVHTVTNNAELDYLFA